MRVLCLAVLAIAALGIVADPARASRTAIRVAPKAVDFGTRPVTEPPTDFYEGTRITNASGMTLQVVVSAGLPDDFGFGLMPGSTCPVFASDPPMAPRQSCDAVVRFTPTAFFAGWLQTGTLTVTATDPVTGSLVASVEVPVRGTGKL
jgi:hypothetical protein